MNKERLGIARNGLILAAAIIVVTLFIGRFFGYEANVISGNSMHPTLKDGDLVITKPANELQTGDIIVFPYNGIPTIHRITAVEENGYRTKGDAEGLLEEAQLVPKTSVVGQQWLTVPAVGGLWTFVLGISAFQLILFGAIIIALTYVKWDQIFDSPLKSGEETRKST